MVGWGSQARVVSVVVDNDSWILPHAAALVDELRRRGDHAVLCRRHEEIPQGDVAFYLGCVHLTPEAVLARNRFNLVVHESDLPMGRGFSPLSWLILEGAERVPICLLHMSREADAGPLVYREWMAFEGHELIDEMRRVQGETTVALCLRFMAEPSPPEGVPQVGEATFHPRRRPADSRLDPERTLKEQFNLLRIVDNDSYPAFFDMHGYRYRLIIEKVEDP